MIKKIGDNGGSVEAIQQALIEAGFNDLRVNGYFDTQMESVVQTFQIRENLKPDGIVGNKTIRALGLSWVIVNPVEVKNTIVQIANQQYIKVWKRGSLKEADHKIRPILLDYWENGPGVSRLNIIKEVLENHPENKGLAEDILIDFFVTNVPWSAAYISWVMNKAGAEDKFPKSRAHWQYVKAAKQNRATLNWGNPIWAFQCDEERPQVGDIIVKSRGNNKATWDNHEQKQTHGDIVVEIDSNRIFVIGGNVNNSVSQRMVGLDKFGFIETTGGPEDDYFAIVRIMDE